MSRFNAFGQPIGANGAPIGGQQQQGNPVSQGGMPSLSADAIRALGGLMRQQQMSQLTPFGFGIGMQAAGQENFSPLLMQAMGQMGELQQGNADRTQQNRMFDTQTQLAREAAHDKNERFSMLFKALIGDPKATPQEEWKRDPNTGNAYRGFSGLSPLMATLLESMGNTSPGGSIFSQSMSSGGSGSSWRV